ncbi:MAG: hypothetical protein Q9216_002477 [Gyalolechia sp. 2 TL-2023]
MRIGLAYDSDHDPEDDRNYNEKARDIVRVPGTSKRHSSEKLGTCGNGKEECWNARSAEEANMINRKQNCASRRYRKCWRARWQRELEAEYEEGDSDTTDNTGKNSFWEIGYLSGSTVNVRIDIGSRESETHYSARLEKPKGEENSANQKACEGISDHDSWDQFGAFIAKSIS